MKGRPFVVKQYQGIQLAAGMRVRDGKYGHIEVTASYQSRRRTKTFPLTSSLGARLQWQYQAMEDLRLRREVVEEGGPTLRQDVGTYLASLGFAQQGRAWYWLSYWVDFYGHMRRKDLQLAHCHRFFQLVKPKRGKALSASSKNKLRTYLINVWRYHDGRRHTCPVQDVPRWEETHGQRRVRELHPSLVLRLLDHMEDTPNRARIGVLFTTGCRPYELRFLTPERWVLDGDMPHVNVTSAKGGKDRTIPLPPLGVAYAKDFLRHRGWTGRHNLGRDMLRAAKRAGINPYAEDPHPCGRRRLVVTPYALRHSYAMNLRRAGAGIEDIADALGHRSLETSRIYAGPIPAKQAGLVERMWSAVPAPAALYGTDANM